MGSLFLEHLLSRTSFYLKLIPQFVGHFHVVEFFFSRYLELLLVLSKVFAPTRNLLLTVGTVCRLSALWFFILRVKVALEGHGTRRRKNSNLTQNLASSAIYQRNSMNDVAIPLRSKAKIYAKRKECDK